MRRRIPTERSFHPPRGLVAREDMHYGCGAEASEEHCSARYRFLHTAFVTPRVERCMRIWGYF